eukprot:1145666-Pelagomonas_calceolata.AAC.1
MGTGHTMWTAFGTSCTHLDKTHLDSMTRLGKTHWTSGRIWKRQHNMFGQQWGQLLCTTVFSPLHETSIADAGNLKCALQFD